MYWVALVDWGTAGRSLSNLEALDVFTIHFHVGRILMIERRFEGKHQNLLQDAILWLFETKLQTIY